MPWVVSQHFEESLVSWQAPERFLGTLGHFVSPTAPSGIVMGLATHSLVPTDDPAEEGRPSGAVQPLPLAVGPSSSEQATGRQVSTRRLALPENAPEESSSADAWVRNPRNCRARPRHLPRSRSSRRRQTQNRCLLRPGRGTYCRVGTGGCPRPSPVGRPTVGPPVRANQQLAGACAHPARLAACRTSGGRGSPISLRHDPSSPSPLRQSHRGAPSRWAALKSVENEPAPAATATTSLVGERAIVDTSPHPGQTEVSSLQAEAAPGAPDADLPLASPPSPAARPRCHDVPSAAPFGVCSPDAGVGRGSDAGVGRDSDAGGSRRSRRSRPQSRRRSRPQSRRRSRAQWRRCWD